MNRGNMSWVHKANRERHSEQDVDRKYRIIKILKKHFNLIALGLITNVYFRNKITNKVIITPVTDIWKYAEFKGKTKGEIFQQYEISLPDLYIKPIPGIPTGVIIELDGSIHGYGDDLTESEQTTDRNNNYRLGGFTKESGTLIIITESDEKNDDEYLIKKISGALGV